MKACSRNTIGSQSIAALAWLLSNGKAQLKRDWLNVFSLFSASAFGFGFFGYSWGEISLSIKIGKLMPAQRIGRTL